MEKEMLLLMLAGAVAVFHEIMSMVIWSFLLYLNRGEFNKDNREDTPDEFLLLNRNIGTFQPCYILNYSLIGVGWGFFKNDGFVYKKTNWIAWAKEKGDRFPTPINLQDNDIQTINNLINRR